MATKRLRHKGGVSKVTRSENQAGEWSVQVEPDNLLIDFFHKGMGPHVHDPKDYERRIVIGETTCARAYEIVVAHLEMRGGLEFEALLEELGTHED